MHMKCEKRSEEFASELFYKTEQIYLMQMMSTQNIINPFEIEEN